jgi:hypothetical protein
LDVIKISDYNNLIDSISNIQEWHDEGYTGKGSHTIIAESDTASTHSKYVTEQIAHFSPDTMIYNYKMTAYGEQQLYNYIKELVDLYPNDRFTLSMSLGINYSGVIFEHVQPWVIKIIEELKVAVFISSGNADWGEPTDIIKSNKKFHPDMVVCGAFSAINQKLEAYSCYEGNFVDCVGLVGRRMSDNHYFTGTSEACPYVAGLWNTYTTLYPTATADEFLDACTVDVGDDGIDNKTGHGLVILPSIKSNPLAVKMFKPDGHQIYVHRAFTDNAISKGYTF